MEVNIVSEDFNRNNNNKGSYNRRNRYEKRVFNEKESDLSINESDTPENTDNKANVKQHQQGVNFKQQPTRQRPNPKEFKKVKVEETVEDIAKDITRIEKEIDLEIKEIMALKLGL